MTKQVRFIPNVACGLKVREAEDGKESRTIVGTPIVFGVRSVNLTPWSDYREVYEVLEPGCISDELLRESDIILNINHSSRVTDILGRCNKGEGNLQLARGLNNIGCECDVVKTTNANDTLTLIRENIITGMSFAFDDDWEDSENGVSYERMRNEDHDGKEVWVRHVKRITALYDVSVVTHPAYEQTSVATREQSDRINAAIEAQLKREQGEDPAATPAPSVPAGSASGEETPEERAAREQREAEAKAKAEREQREREAEERLREQEQREREIMAARLRHRRQRLTDEILSNIEY